MEFFQTYYSEIFNFFGVIIMLSGIAYFATSVFVERPFAHRWFALVFAILTSMLGAGRLVYYFGRIFLEFSRSVEGFYLVALTSIPLFPLIGIGFATAALYVRHTKHINRRNVELKRMVDYQQKQLDAYGDLLNQQ